MSHLRTATRATRTQKSFHSIAGDLRLLSLTAREGGDSRARWSKGPGLGGESVTARRQRNNSSGAARIGDTVKVDQLQDTFIRSLVRASTCRTCISARHRDALRSTNKRHLSTTTIKRRSVSVALPVFEDGEASTKASGYVPREQYLYLGETYALPSDLWELANPQPPILPSPALPIPQQQDPLHGPRPNYSVPPLAPAYPSPPLASSDSTLPPLVSRSAAAPTHLPLAPRLVLTPEQESKPPLGTREILPAENESHQAQLNYLKRLLRQRTTATYSVCDEIWRAYNVLPRPRPRYIADKRLEHLFRKFAVVEFKDIRGAKRYFALLEECLECDISLPAEVWNTAIAFAGRCVRGVSGKELRAAVEIWMRMENLGVAATNVTFNILFDVAIRAGRFALADTLARELHERDLPLNRFFRTSKIHAAGLLGSGEKVRKAFRELVNAGEIVDTAVMNCVVLSLIRSHEPAAAENVVEKMKMLHQTKFGTAAPRNWLERRKLGYRLDAAAESLRDEQAAHENSFFGSSFSTAEKKEAAQRAAPIGPDAHTCRILIRWHSLQSGDLDRVRALFDELKEGEWGIHGSCFFDVFRGFEIWGGDPGGSWNAKVLEEFWAMFLLRFVGSRPVQTDDVDDEGGSEASNPKENQGSEAEAVMDEFVETNPDLGLETSLSPNLASAIQAPYTPLHTARSSRGQDHPREQHLEPGSGTGPTDTNSEFQYDNPILAAANPTDISHEAHPPFFTPHLVIAILRAFHRCAGPRRMLEVAKEIRGKWEDATEDEVRRVQEFVQQILA